MGVLLKQGQIIQIRSTETLKIEIGPLNQFLDESLRYFQFVLWKHEIVFLYLDDVANDGVGVGQEDTFHWHFKSHVKENEEECDGNGRDQ